MSVLPTDPQRRLLLLSNSRNPGGGFLDHAADALRDHLGAERERVLFVPYAGVTLSWDDYAARVRERFEPLGYGVDSIHEADDPRRAVEEAEAVVIGGGNTWLLLRELCRHDLLPAIRARVNGGVPYVGWSAGANVACPTIKTTNDMPIVEPPAFEALGLVPFQINPHYTAASIPNHGGETRPDRIAEFLVANPSVPVVGLPEGAWLAVDGERTELFGKAALFRYGAEPAEMPTGVIEAM